jgi:hypothetical protein
MLDVVSGVVVANELDRIGDRTDKIFFLNNDGHGEPYLCFDV